MKIFLLEMKVFLLETGPLEMWLIETGDPEVSEQLSICILLFVVVVLYQ